jgi:phosphoribosylaminoimidazole-succinocarboxamide synthase
MDTLIMAEETVVTSTSLSALPKIAEGKVRDLYEVDSKTLLFVASDRISAYDVIMENVQPPPNLLYYTLTILRASPQKANF